MASRIITKKGSGAPLASDLVHGELAVDTVNKRLYTENAGGTIIEVGTSPSTIDINAGTIDGTVIGGSTAAAGTFTTLTASDDVNFDSGTLFVDASANAVGIGTSSPAVKLHIEQNQATYTYCDLVNLTNGGGTIFRQIVRNIANSGTTTVDLAKLIGSGFVVNNNDTNAANFTAFGVGASERMRIDSAGRVGISTSSPAAKLEIGGAGEGIILASPDGTRYEITVANGGTLTVTAV